MAAHMQDPPTEETTYSATATVDLKINEAAWNTPVEPVHVSGCQIIFFLFISCDILDKFRSDRLIRRWYIKPIGGTKLSGVIGCTRAFWMILRFTRIDSHWQKQTSPAMYQLQNSVKPKSKKELI